ncbi:MAG: FAD:protein FMN transferase [Acidobacteriota bacterium]|nr:FAD:protein FMN transferase [Acidobacteriota bacterium]
MIELIAAIGLALGCALWALVERAARRDGDDDSSAACGGCGLRGAPPDDPAEERHEQRPLVHLRRHRRGVRGRGTTGTSLFLVALPLATIVGLTPGCGAPSSLELTRPAMGTAFRITVVTEDAERATEAMEAAFVEIDRLEDLLSEWREGSEISRVNREAAGRPVPVGPELLEVVERSLAIARLTGGAFDVTVAACGSLWSFTRQRVPGDEELRGCLLRVGWEKVGLDSEARTLFFADEGMRIGISGIGKGFGVDAAARVLESHGIAHYIVDGGGDVRLRGRNNDRPWRVGVAHPRERGRLFAELELSEGAIVTSGDYVQFFEREGERHHHILDPRTGRPAPRSSAVTVIAGNATDADALATGLFVLGPEEGLALAESLPGVEALIFDAGATPHATSGFPLP